MRVLVRRIATVAVIPCRKCTKKFKSVDITINKICPACNRANSTIRVGKVCSTASGRVMKNFPE